MGDEANIGGKQRTVREQAGKTVQPYGPLVSPVQSAATRLDQELQNYNLPANYVAPITGTQREALGGIGEVARRGTPITPAAERASYETLGFQDPYSRILGGYGAIGGLAGLGGRMDTATTGGTPNPYLAPALQAAFDPMVSEFTERTLPQAGAMFSGQGRLRGGGGLPAHHAGRLTEAFGRGATQSLTQLLNQSVEAQAGRADQAQRDLLNLGMTGLGTAGTGLRGEAATRVAALGATPYAQAQRYADLDRLYGAGRTMQDLRSARLRGAGEATMDRLSAPARALGILAPSAARLGGTTGYQDETYFRPTLMDAGLAIGGNALSSYLGRPG